MPNSKQIVYLSQSQYAELITNGTITVDGVTVTYDENDIYVTPQAEPVTDVRVNGTSIASNGVANIPVVTTFGATGAVKITQYRGLAFETSTGSLTTQVANEGHIKSGVTGYAVIDPVHQHQSTFYGLAKASGDSTQSSSSNAVGTYTDEAKGSIQRMLGVTSLLSTEESSTATAAHALNSTFMMNGKLHRATAAIAIGDAVEVGTNCEVVKADEVFVKNTDYASTSAPGVVKVSSNNGTQIINGIITTYNASDAEIKAGNSGYKILNANNQHKSVFYGLAKAAGSDEKNSTLPVGQYTDAAKAAIQNMLGTDTIIADNETDPFTNAHAIGELFTMNGKLYQVTAAISIGDAMTVGTNCAVVNIAGVFPHDVQVNGTSVVSQGVANVPLASSDNAGVVKIHYLGSQATYGIGISNGEIFVSEAAIAHIKSGTTSYRPIVPARQHESVFYGLAKASGDTTQSASSNAVGVYTDNAKASIKSMLGIVDGSTGTVDVSGTTPTITAVENTRYTCGEVSTLTITPPASGICIVRFTSGTTATVLTATGVVWPEWFDDTALEASRVYEICITDGYGAVMSWAQ